MLSFAMQPVIEGAWTALDAALTILNGVASTPADGSPVQACGEREAAPWTFLANAEPGAQLNEKIKNSVRAATVKDSKDSITRTALIIFVVMLLTIVLCGLFVILPNLFAVQRLQTELMLKLLDLPIAIRLVRAGGFRALPVWSS